MTTPGMEYNFKIRYSRGSGPGGQRKNKVETRVEVIHEATGMKETCQDTPSRARNQQIATGRLIKRIKEQKALEAKDRRNELRLKTLGGGTVIRTYNFPRGVVVNHDNGKKAPLKDILKGKLNLLR